MLSIRYLIFVICWYRGYYLYADDQTAYQYARDNLEETHGNIIYSSVIFRHGDRTIKARYPTDPYPEYIWGGRLQLTKKGKQQAYDLGKWYRRRYQKLLGDQGYNYSLILMNSTNTDRALMSAEVFLAGMFPPTQDELWADDGLKWQPVPVHTALKEHNNVIGDVPCLKYDLERQYWSSSPEVQSFYRQYESTIRYICENANYTTCSEDDVFATLQNVWTVYNALYIEELNGLTLPSWTKKIYPEPGRTISAFYFLSKTYSLEMRRIKGGPLIQNIIKDMERKQEGVLKRNLHFYSGQETTIAIFLNALDLYNFMIPNYTASIMVELRNKNGQFYVTLLYRNATDQPPCLLQVPGCDTHCTLEKFKEVTEYLIIENWDNECHPGYFDQLSYAKFVTKTMIYIGAIFVFCITSFCISIIAVNIVKKRKRNLNLNYEYI